MKLTSLLNQWIADRGWTPFPFQQEAWGTFLAGENGLVHAPTGTGKTLAVWLGPLAEWMNEHPDPARWRAKPPPIRVLWVTPLRALATDTTESLAAPVEALGLPWRVEKRTGDTSGSIKSRQRRSLPTALVTTPESLSLMLSWPDAAERFATLRCVIVDEWHELLSTKRGVQTELALARLRRFAPALRAWGLSATLGNLEQAADVLFGSAGGRIIHGELPKEVRIETLIPESSVNFPWAGHLGLTLLPRVVEAIEAAGSTLLFTNTRSQAEMWYRALLEHRPDWEESTALHHGSLDRELREQVEKRLRTGEVKCVVCTSSLDLGVDFSPVDQVIQLGSPKGIARLLQRAGRSGHRPGEVSRILCVPTNAFELVEFSAARAGADVRSVEPREPLEAPLDVLCQHLVTVALGGGFRAEELLAEVRSTYAYRDLRDEAWRWCLDFISRGGNALRAYPQYRKVEEHDGTYSVSSDLIAKFHRLSIGTITQDSMMRVKFQRGAAIGNVEEHFLARLRPGDRFLFGGRALELIRIKDMTAYVRRAKGTEGAVPRWMGGRMPLSSLLGDAVRGRVDEARRGVFTDAEMKAAQALLEIQARWSALPSPDELLIESTKSREGAHTFVFTFAGRLVNEGLGSLLAYRVARGKPLTVTVMANDYGLSMLSRKPIGLTEEGWRRALSPESLLEDLLECLNATELARRRFREVARVAGLVFQGYPGAHKSARQVQASSTLIYDVFRQFDPENLLLDQARREVLENQLEHRRMERALRRIEGMKLLLREPTQLTPFAFPLWTEMNREHLSTEKWIDRVQDMVARLEKTVGE